MGEPSEWRVLSESEVAGLLCMPGLLRSVPVGKTVLIGCQGPAPEPTCEFCTQPSSCTHTEPPGAEEGACFVKANLPLRLSTNIESRCFVTSQCSFELFPLSEASSCKEYSRANELGIV